MFTLPQAIFTMDEFFYRATTYLNYSGSPRKPLILV
jgi:hypothetical protein